MKNIKEAVKKVNESLLQKRAGGFADSIGAGIASPTLMNLHPVTGIERLLAAVGDDPSKEEIKGYDKNPIPSLLVGPYRDIRRRREMLSRAGKDAGYHVAAEELANPGLGWAALLGGLGVGQFALREHLADKAGGKALAEYIKSHPLPENSPHLAYKERMEAAEDVARATRRAGEESRINTGVVLGGLGLTALAAELAAPIVAAITPTRTAEEQLKHDKGSSWKSWLIPGVASYNRYKRLGRIIAEDAEREAKQQKTATAIEKSAGAGVPGSGVQIIQPTPRVKGDVGKYPTGVEYRTYLEGNLGLNTKSAEKRGFVPPRLTKEQETAPITPKTADQINDTQINEYIDKHFKSATPETQAAVRAYLKRQHRTNMKPLYSEKETTGRVTKPQGAPKVRPQLAPGEEPLQDLSGKQQRHLLLQGLFGSNNVDATGVVNG